MRSERRQWKWLLMTAVVAGVGLFAARDAAAQCTNDDDCPDSACGGQICDWNSTPHKCIAAGTGSGGKGKEGWCTGPGADNCKCKAQGATCEIVYCSFTKASDAPGGGTGGAAATGGASGTGGASTGTGGASTGTGGASTGTGGASTADAGTKPKDDGGGCAVAGSAATPSFLGIVLALGIAIGVRRKRTQD